MNMKTKKKSTFLLNQSTSY